MLRELRTKKGYTQEEISKLCDIHQTTYGRYELKQRTPPIQTFNKICEVLKLNNKQRVELMRSFEKGD